MSEPLWTAREIVKAGGRFEVAPAATFGASGVSIDSRTLEPGDLFIAIKGAARATDMSSSPRPRSCRRDGRSCARGCFVRCRPRARPRYAARPACWARSRASAQRARRIAVTGSVGKTGTKEAAEKLRSVHRVRRMPPLGQYPGVADVPAMAYIFHRSTARELSGEITP
ncbi:MAG: hypothetical protein U1E87_01840 [Alphaproteobacteria bacterium]